MSTAERKVYMNTNNNGGCGTTTMLPVSNELLPDMSHLTEEERHIIESVMARQKEEEDKEQQILRRKQDEVRNLEDTIKLRNEEQKKTGAELDATCQLCLKTKFADGIGHICNYCQVRCCARCGGKVTLRSNKVIWVCILCRKKQELLIKTGKWMHGGMAGGGQPLISKLELDLLAEVEHQRPGSMRTPSGRNAGARLERGHSCEKTEPSRVMPPLPGQLQRSGSQQGRELRRQYSQEHVGVGGDQHHPPDRGRQLPPTQQIQQQQQQQQQPPPVERRGSGGGRRRSLPDADQQLQQQQQEDARFQQEQRGRTVHGGDRSREPSGERGRDWDRRGPARDSPGGGGRYREERRRDESYRETDRRDSSGGDLTADTVIERRGRGSREPSPRRERGSGTDEVGRGRTRLPGGNSRGGGHAAGGGAYDSAKRSEEGRRGVPAPGNHQQQPQPPQRHLPTATAASESEPGSLFQQQQQQGGGGDPRKNHLDPSSANSRSRGGRRKMDAVMRNDSLSSDQSESVRPPPPKPHKHKRGKKQRQRSLSSSDDEIRSTPDCTSCEDQEIESESVSEKGELEILGEKWKKEEILDAKIKKFLAHPVSWTPSPDGTQMIGHMILKKSSRDDPTGSSSGAAILGLKVVGGRRLESGRLGAVVERVKRGSIADTVGHLREGDEVLEWNGRHLPDKSYEDVLGIIAESRQERQVELVVSRQLTDVKGHGFGRPDQSRMPPTVGSVDTRSGSSHVSRKHGGQNHRPSVTVTSPGSPEMIRSRSQVSGRIQVKLWFDNQQSQLNVTVVCAEELPPRTTSQARNPYVKLVLLPDRSEKSKRRTRTVVNTNEPRWNQSFSYMPLRRAELQCRVLEISVWDYDRVGVNDFLGEVIIDLSTTPLDDEVEWYFLSAHNESLASNMRVQTRSLYMDAEAASSVASTDRLSPPSTISRLSDSDMSEFDFDDNPGGHRGGGGRGSMGSSGSPPFMADDGTEPPDRRSRRDASSPHRRGRLPTVVRREDVNPQPQPPPSTYMHQQYRQQQQRAPAAEPALSPRLRSRSAAPCDVPSGGAQHRARSKSPPPPRRGILDNSSRSLSPPDSRPRSPVSTHSMPGMRSLARSANNTPTGTPSPRKRQLPQVPAYFRREPYLGEMQHRSLGGSSRVTTPSGMYSDSEVFSRFAQPPRHQRPLAAHYPTGPGGIPQHRNQYHMRPSAISPDKDLALDSDLESTASAMSTQSERQRGPSRFSQFSSKFQAFGPAMPGKSRAVLERGYSQGDVPVPEKTDGSLSDTAVGSITDRIGAGVGGKVPAGHGSHASKMAAAGLTKKSSSTSQLSNTGSKHRLGFRRKQASAFTVHRSEEVAPSAELLLARQQSSGNQSSDEGSQGSEGWIPSMRLTTDGSYSDFVEGLGPGQLVGRQVLASASVGDIQLSLCDRKGKLEVEVIRARGLQPKQGAKSDPAPYVKVYLYDGKKCIEKAKTSTARRTRDPLYQQQLTFTSSYKGCVVHVTVYGDYGRMEGKKVPMGVAQILLDDLNLTNIVIGWYKLFGTNSLVIVPAGMSRRGSMFSLDSVG